MKFFIPQRTKIFGQEISVKFIKDLKLDGKDVDGISTFNENLIEINDGNEEITYIKSQQELTYIHELCHQLFDNLSEHRLSSNEKFIYGFSSGLYQYLSSAVYKEKSDFIPESFMLFGQKIKVSRAKKITISDDDKHISSVVMHRNKISVLKYSSKIEGFNIPNDRINVGFLQPLIIWIFHLMGEHKLQNNIKLIYKLSAGIHQVLIEAVK